jgi:hypothetical protein
MSSRAQIEAVPFAFVDQPRVKATVTRTRFWQSTVFLKKTHHAVRSARRVLAASTLVIPFAYFAQAMIDAGVFRAKAFEMIHCSGIMQTLVAPGRAVGEALFATGVIRDGWNLWLLGVTVMTLILRHQVVMMMRGVETRIAAKYASKKKPVLPHALRYVVPQVDNVNRLGRA